MKEFPKLKSKLTTPSKPEKSVYSERIKNMGIENNRLTVLTAQAGFGKTTAVLLSLEKFRSQIRWYRLDKEDNYLPVFYSHLIETLFIKDEEKLSAGLHMLYSMNKLEEEYVLLNAHICQNLEEMLSSQNEKIYLVLDDYHNVVNNESIRETIKYFVVNFPQNSSIVITSRVETGIVGGKFVLQRDINCVSSENLLFTKPELETLVAKEYKIDYNEESLDLLYKYSEGWITGVYLICHSLNNILDLNKGIKSLKAQNENIFSLYLSNFLNKIDKEKRDLLIKLSLLESFSVEDLRELFEIKDGQNVINWLENSNLYIQKIMTKPVRYRFHSLFSTELERMYMESTPISEQREFLKSIASYYEQSDIQLAIRYLLKAKEELEAIKLGEQVAKECFVSSNTEKMFYILTEFSEEQVQKSPYLQLFTGMMIMNVRIDDCLNYLTRAMEGFKENCDYSFLMNTFGVIIVTSFQMNNFLHLKEISKKLPISKIALKGGAALDKLLISLFISLVGDDKLSKANVLSKIIDKMNIEEGLWSYAYLMIKGILHYRRGQLREAKQITNLLLSHPAGFSNDQWRIIGLVSCCNLPFLTGDILLLQKFTDEFALLGEKYNSDYSKGYSYFVGVHLDFFQKDIKSAIEKLDRSMEYYESFGATALVKESEIIKYLWSESTDFEDMIMDLEISENYFELENTGHGMTEFCRAIKGVLHKRSKKWIFAERSLTESLNISLRKDAKQSVCGCNLHLADLYYSKGETEKGERHLKDWIACSEENNYTFFREMDVPTILRMSEIAIKNGIHSNFAHQLKEMYKADKQIVEDKREIYVKYFGDFKLNYREQKISEKDFKTKKVSGILKYILLNNKNSRISREKLMTLFWPDSDVKAAGASLRVALYELRKTLAKYDLVIDGKNALIKEDREGFVIGEDTIIHSDLKEIEEMYLDWKDKSLNNKNELEILKKICDLYEGNFLENFYYDDRIEVLRSHYSSIALECIHAYSKLCDENGFYDEGERILLKGLEIDPIDEIGCGLLISLYKKTGKSDRGQSFLRKFEKNFIKEMGYKSKIKY